MRLDVPSLVAGLAIAGLGVLVLLDQSGDIDMRFSLFGPVAFAALGAILLASGLSRRS